MKWNCKKLVAIFYKRRHVMQARRSWIPSWTPETHNLNLSERPKCPVSFMKMCLVFFRQSLILRVANHMTINQVIGMSHGKQEPIGSGCYHDIIHLTSPSSWRHHFAFTKMADSQKYWQKYTRLSPSNYTFFGLIFQRRLTCIRNNIVLHVYFYLKCNENSRKAAYHAQLVQGVVSYALCVCVCDVSLPNFAPFYQIDNNGRH